MANEKLLEYIRNRKQAGESEDKIRQDLKVNGWSSNIIDEAFSVPAPKGEKTVTHLLSVKELFSESFSLFTKKFWSLLLIMVVPGLLVILGGVMSTVIIGSVSTIFSSGYLPMIILAVILFVVFTLITIWSSVALVTSLASKEKLSLADAFKKSFKFVSPYVFINFLIFFIVIGGTVLFVVPAIIFSIWFAFSMFVLVIEEKKGFQALMTSREYVIGHWWAVWGRFLLLFFLIAVISMIFSFLAENIDSILLSIFVSVLNIAASIFSSCYSFVIYKNLKEVKGNFELKTSRKTKIIYSLIGILGFLFVSVFPIAIFASVNPAEQISKAKNTQIENQKVVISNAIVSYATEKSSLPQSLYDLVSAGYLKESSITTSDGYCFSVSINLSSEEVDVNYGKDTEISCNSIHYRNE